MSPIAAVVLLTGSCVAGVLLVASGLLQPSSSLDRTLARIGRTVDGTSSFGVGRVRAGCVAPVVRRVESHDRWRPTDADLRLAGRTLEQHVVRLLAAATAGLVAPPLVLGALRAAGLVDLTILAPTFLSLAGVVAGPVAVHLVLVDGTTRIRADLRHQLSAYLDVTTMLLAGNTGYEGALEQAAHAGDGRLFVELRRRMREAATRGTSLTEALDRTGVELGIDELRQVAATASLSAAEGAPVARTLAAKCATLRSALAAEHESEARLRTSRLTTPIVGMALIFMALVMYPALTFS